MKRYFLKVAAVFVSICGIKIQSASAATGADALFVTVGEAMMKGLTGIAAVVVMGAGIWLHGKSNIAKWNAFMKQLVGKAAASGSILSFAFISFLSVFREGAEMLIFYSGMAPDMSAEALAGVVSIFHRRSSVNLSIGL
ncbi:FTR1 family protein [Domibacillus sp.]|uniref:FTR1 family protein n=1 Tax=Domibacillus sp. TaxID=1969783 RepID=UPI002811F26A|nr:FTR1 family protein [Domibacillus sp.]